VRSSERFKPGKAKFLSKLGRRIVEEHMLKMFKNIKRAPSKV